ncbi:MAG: Ion transport 2 domain protein [Sphingobacteriales bacterium]|nr:MAG: Ion transport 2 domain protein [Sphingobacteriales bacterium]
MTQGSYDASLVSPQVRLGHHTKGARFVNKDGSPNVRRRGESRFSSFNIYHYLLQMQMGKFFLLVLGFYTIINFLFATFYYLFSLPHLEGIIHGTPAENFEEAFFFSSQTLTTVGYGRISPVGLVTNSIAALEALIGILTLALITGTLYGRFVRPRAYVRFSFFALMGIHEGEPAIMFRLVTSKKTKIHDLQIKVTASLLKQDQPGYDFVPLDLQNDRLNALYLSWLVVHPITPESPFYGLTEVDFAQRDVELFVHLTGFDEQFSSNVVARTSYIHTEMIHNASFVPMYEDLEEHTILYLNRLNQYNQYPGTVASNSGNVSAG